VVEGKYTFEKNIKYNKISLIIFRILLFFLTGNFSNPYISTGTYFPTFLFVNIRFRTADIC
jgi:hypothetical protein